MRSAVDLALTTPAALFRAVIVDPETDSILADGANDAAHDHPLVHGETAAIDRCFRQHPGIDWSRLVLYTTAEPCPMCQSAIGWAGIGTVVYGTSTRTLMELGWHDIPNIRAQEIASRWPIPSVVIGGVLERECDAVFRAWCDDPDTWPPRGDRTGSTTSR